MSFWRQVKRGIGRLRNREGADREIAEEVSHYLEESAAAYEARGWTPEEALRAARAEMGSSAGVREAIRDYGWENAVDTFVSDIRYAVRRLAAKPGFAMVSAMTLALGIGATSAIFSVVNGVILKPLPFPESERLVALVYTAPGIQIDKLNQAASLHYTYSEESRAFTDVAMWTGNSWTLTEQGEPVVVQGLAVTHRFLSTLGVRPALGRDFCGDDENPQGERTAILTDGFWKTQFGGDPSVLGRRILLDGFSHAVIGVLPPGFDFLDRRISMLAPIQSSRAGVRLISFWCQGFARLKPGVTLEEANADAARMLLLAPAKFAMNSGMARNAFTDARIAPRLRLLKEDLIGDIDRMLWVLLGTVGIVLAIACANVANLLLVRADGRRQELAIRAALGAGWGRIARELLIESVLLSVAGCLLGLPLAYAALRLFTTTGLAQLPRMNEISIDGTVLLFSAGVSLASGLSFGLIPVMKFARPRVAEGLHGGSRSFTGSREQNRARSVLVVVQVALALVLLVGSGLMLRSFQALRSVDPGFAGAKEVETFRIGITASHAKEAEAVLHLQEAVLRKVESIGGISSVAMASVIPMDGGSTNPVYAEGHIPDEGGIPPVRRYKFVSPGFAATTGARLVAGREFTWSDLQNRSHVVMISENMARELWKDPRAAVGKLVRGSLQDPWKEVIGILGDLRDNGVEERAPTIVYWPLLMRGADGRENAIRSVAYLTRTPRAGTTSLREELQRAVASVSPSLAIAEVRTLDSRYQRSLARTSLTLALLGIAGAMAMLLGVVGIYGVISYSVAQRTREVGIRIALGAPLRDVTGAFVRHGIAISGIGAACGLAAASVATRWMRSLLFEVSPVDPATYATAAGVLISAALLGSYLPARRAARVDPTEALRAD